MSAPSDWKTTGSTVEAPWMAGGWAERGGEQSDISGGVGEYQPADPEMPAIQTTAANGLIGRSGADARCVPIPKRLFFTLIPLGMMGL